MGMNQRPLAGLVAALFIAIVGGACGSSGSGSQFVPGGPDASTPDGSPVGDDGPSFGDGMSFLGDGSFGDDAAQGGGFDVEPSVLGAIAQNLS